MQQNVIDNKFNREYASLAILRQSEVIEFTVKGANILYLNLNNSRLLVLAKIIKADNTNINAKTAGWINMTLHSMFCTNGVELNN